MDVSIRNGKKKKKKIEVQQFSNCPSNSILTSTQTWSKKFANNWVLNKKKVKMVNNSNSNPKPLQIHTYTARADTSPQIAATRRGSYSNFTYFPTKSLIGQYTFQESFFPHYFFILIFLSLFLVKIYFPLVSYFVLVFIFLSVCQPNFLGFSPQTQQTWAKQYPLQILSMFSFIYLYICVYACVDLYIYRYIKFLWRESYFGFWF